MDSETKEKEKIVLAYSGGLDTSVILKWLTSKGNEVIAFIADVGQNENLQEVKRKAFEIGASKVYLEDLKKELVEEYVSKAVKANAIYEGKYLLGTALARPIIAKKQVEIAEKENTKKLAHGCTGKGNDQIRFEITWMHLMPDVEIISPWKEKDFLEKFKGRTDLMNYAKANSIPVKASKENPYSIDENLIHTSYESGLLEDMSKQPEGVFEKITPLKETPDYETQITIEFEKGVAKKVIAKENRLKIEIKGSLQVFNYLNEIGAKHGVGRSDIVENRFIGIKSRGLYESPGMTILLAAHKDLESITLDKEVMHIKELLSPIIAKIIYNGFWFSPEMDFLMSSIEKSQEIVNGKVHITLYKGNILVTGRESENSLYNASIASMDEEGGFNQEDAKGFIKIHGMRFKCKNENKLKSENVIGHEVMAEKL